MSPNARHSSEPPAPRRARGLWGAMALAGLTAFGFWLWFSPVYSFHPFCTYTVNARVTADIEVGGEKLTSTVVYQNSRSQRWIYELNSAGCKQTYGRALTYKLKDDRVLILPVKLCHPAEQAYARDGNLDILRECSGHRSNATDMAFLVDSATHPTRWKIVRNGIDFRIASMTATSTWSNPSDDIASVAPNLLRATFKYGLGGEYESPEAFIDFFRRYDRDRSRSGFDFQVEKSNF